MGIISQKSSNHLQFHPNHPQKIISNQIQQVNCYGICGKNKKQRSTTSIWKINFNKNLEELRNNSCKWVNQIRNAYIKFHNKDRSKYMKEFQIIKQEFKKQMESSSVMGNNSQKSNIKQIREVLMSSVIFQQEIILNKKQSTLQISKSNLSNMNKSVLINKQIQHPLKKIKRPFLISFIDQRIQMLFNASEEIDKQSKDILNLFIKITQMIEKHCQANTLLHQIKIQFIKYLKKQYQGLRQITVKTYRNLNEDINQFIKFYRITINDYYKIHSVEDLVNKHFYLFNPENFTNAVTAILFKNKILYKIVEDCYTKIQKAQEQQIQRLLEQKKNVNPQDLGINAEFCLNKKTLEWYISKLSVQSNLENMDISIVQEYQPYEMCIIKLNQIMDAQTPIGKLKVIVSCAEKMTQCIKKFYENNNIQSKSQLIDADQVLSIFCYIFIKSAIKNIYTHIKIIQNFTSQTQKMSITGYYFSVMMSAVQNLQQKNNSEASYRPITFGEN